jgi:hypothetical protein
MLGLYKPRPGNPNASMLEDNDENDNIVTRPCRRRKML